MRNKKQKKKSFAHSAFLQNRKAELSTQQIVLIIILIASFIVILFFLFRLGVGEKSEEQLCHNSVLQKASAFSEAPLQCYRDYVCITENGDCGELIKPEKIKVKTLDEVYETLANEMTGCWWMYGEGKVDYVGKASFFKDNYCSICSQIYFDNSLEALEGIENKKISKDELYDYLSTNNYSKDETYAQYLFGTKIQEGSFGNIEIGKQYFNVMGITDEVGWGGYIIGGTVAVAGFFLGYTWIGLGIAAITIATSEVAGEIEPEILAITVEGESGNQFMAPTLQEADSDKFKALNCEEILTYT